MGDKKCEVGEKVREFKRFSFSYVFGLGVKI